MLIRLLVVFIVSSLVTELTQGLPGITRQKVVIPLEYEEFESAELDALLQLKVLKEEEWKRRDELLAEKRALYEKMYEEKKDYIRSYVSGGEGFRKLRYSTLLYVIALWALYAFVLPRSLSEYLLSMFPPFAYCVDGVILSVELICIVLMLLLVFLIKSKLWCQSKVE